MTAPFAWAAPSGQAPTPGRGSAALRHDGLDGECARQAIIVVPRCGLAPPLTSGSIRPTAPLHTLPLPPCPTASGVAEPEAPLRPHQHRTSQARYRVASFNYRDGKPFKIRAPAHQEAWLAGLREELVSKTYLPDAVRRVSI